MDGETSPTSADVAEQMGIKNEEPPADEPLALVKRVKIKVEPGFDEEAEQEEPMNLAQTIDSKMDIKTQIKLAEVQTSSLPVLTTGTNLFPQNVLYTVNTNGVMPTVPQLVDLIPTQVNGKAVRPFKAYNANRELLAGLPTSAASYPAVPVALSGPIGAAVPLSVPNVVVSSNSAVQVVNSNGGPNAHLMTLATEADKLSQKTHNGHVKLEGDSDEPMTPGSASGGSDAGSAGDLLEETILKIKKRAGITSVPTPATTAAPITVMVPIAPAPSSNSKKSKKSRGNPLPPEPNRDDHYWERRRKNNEAAKRSRDARRCKEDQIAIRAALLEQENMRLRIEVAALKEETVQLRAMLVAKK